LRALFVVYVPAPDGQRLMASAWWPAPDGQRLMASAW